ncbi:DUF481 domain-containing protein [Prochlorococcus marinus]|uniref:DUF481 domain-containing protein n=1 Tax=Prochlorococcus TaxID=1218 RepID=UPI001F1D2783|nr:DUF481 domain-containing protein [Prochlorococcus marinus]
MAKSVYTFTVIGAMIPLQYARAENLTLKLINGDVVSGEYLPEESNNKIKVLLSPYFGRIEVDASFIKPESAQSLWLSSVDVGIDGSNTGDDLSFGYSLSASTRFKGTDHEFNASASFDFDKSVDAESVSTIDTNQGALSIRYDRILSSPKWSAYASTDYTYNALNDVGVNTNVFSIGFGYKVLDNKKLSLRVSLGPSLIWFDGGFGCSTGNYVSDGITLEKYCGEIIPSGTIGAAIEWDVNEKFRLSIKDQLTGSFVNGMAAGNDLSGTLKFFPSKDSKFYMSLVARLIYSALHTPDVDNTFNFKLGTEF